MVFPQMRQENFIERSSCPSCNSGSLTRLLCRSYEDPLIQKYLVEFYTLQGYVEPEFLKGVDYVIEKCADCALIFQRFVPNEEMMVRIYEHWIDPVLTFEQFERSHEYSYYLDYATTIDAVIRFIGRIPSKIKILDFAMGWGNWAQMARAFGCEVYGTELSESRLAFACRNNIEIIQWEDIPGSDFDFVNTDQVFEHLAEPRRILGHLCGGLSENGFLRICVPDGSEIEKKLENENWTADKNSPQSMNEVAPLEHINCFSNRSLKVFAGLEGLEAIRMPYRLTNEGLVKETFGEQLKLSLRSIKWLTSRLINRNRVENVSTDLYFRKPRRDS